MLNYPSPAPQSEWFRLTLNHGKIRSKVVSVDEQTKTVIVRPVSEEEYRLTPTYKGMRKITIKKFNVEYIKS